ncbi:MAG: signal recognition particle receptor subunit alpha, partial [Actinomycetota bacterium]
MSTQVALLILIGVTLVFGFGVVLLNRRSASSKDPVPIIEREPSVASGLRGRLGRTATVIAGTVLGIRERGAINDDTWEDLEEALLRADVGVRVTASLLEGLRDRVRGREIADADE